MNQPPKKIEEPFDPNPPEFHSNPLKTLGFFGTLKLVGIVLGSSLSLLILLIVGVLGGLYLLIAGLCFLTQ